MQMFLSISDKTYCNWLDATIIITICLLICWHGTLLLCSTSDQFNNWFPAQVATAGDERLWTTLAFDFQVNWKQQLPPSNPLVSSTHLPTWLLFFLKIRSCLSFRSLGSITLFGKRSNVVWFLRWIKFDEFVAKDHLCLCYGCMPSCIAVALRSVAVDIYREVRYHHRDLGGCCPSAGGERCSFWPRDKLLLDWHLESDLYKWEMFVRCWL